MAAIRPTATTAKARSKASVRCVQLTKAMARAMVDGLRSQDLYTGNSVKMPDGIHGGGGAGVVHRQHQCRSPKAIPCRRMRTARTGICGARTWWINYQPDVLYFDTNELPLGQAGLDVVAHYYNLSAARNGGRADCCRERQAHRAGAHWRVREDIERSTANVIRPTPGRPTRASAIGITAARWPRRIVTRRSQPSSLLLTDIVSKNGNLMLNIPLRGDAPSTIVRRHSSPASRRGWT